MRITHLLDNPDEIVRLIEKYERLLEESLGDVVIAGKTLEVANREQPTLFYKYGSVHAESESVVKLIDMRAEYTRSRVFKRIKDNSDRAMADRTIDKYVESEQEVMDLISIGIEIRNLRDKLAAVVQALTARGYALRNITEARVNQLHSAVL